MKKKKIRKHFCNYYMKTNVPCTNESDCLYCDTCNVCSNFQSNIVKNSKQNNYGKQKK